MVRNLRLYGHLAAAVYVCQSDIRINESLDITSVSMPPFGCIFLILMCL